MTYAVVLASSSLAVVLALALSREVRLRRALPALLAANNWINMSECRKQPGAPMKPRSTLA